MKSKIKIYTLFFLALLTALPLLAVPNIFSRRISVVDGLQGNTIDAIVQDRQGYMWFGGTGGLSRFDGNSFVDFTRAGTPNAATSRHIGLLDYDETNNLLWVTTSTYSHSCLDLNKGQYVDYTGKGNYDRYFRKYYFHAPDMWLYTDTYGIRHIRYANGHFSMHDYTKYKDVSYLACDKMGNAWAKTKCNVLRIDSKGHLEAYHHKNRLLDLRVNGNHIVAMTAANTALIFSPGSMKPVEVALPRVMGQVNEVTTSLLWQDKYVVFTSGITYILDLKTRSFARAAFQVPSALNQGQTDGYQFVANKEKGTLWIFPDHGEARHLDLFPGLGVNSEKGQIFRVVKGRRGRLVIATYGGGLFVWNPQTEEVDHFSSVDREPVIWSDYIYTLLCDQAGCLWLGCDAAGVACIMPQNRASAEYVFMSPHDKNDRANYLKGIYRTANGQIVIATMDNKLYRFDPRGNTVQYLSTADARLYAYYVDRFGREWRGTRGDGLFVGDEHYTSHDKNHYVPCDDFFDIVGEDSQGRIWLATWKGGLLWTKNEKGRPLQFHQMLHSNFNQSRIHDLELTRDGNLYVATLDGLYWIDTHKKDIGDRDVVAFNLKTGDLPANEIYCLHVARDGKLWMGVLGNGVLQCTFSADHRNMEWKAVKQENGLSNNNVVSIVEDRKGNLWLGTEEGISVVSNNQYARSYQFSRQLMGNVCVQNSVMTLDDGRILFGTHSGVAVVTPESTDAVKSTCCPMVTDMLVEGVSIFNTDNKELSAQYYDGEAIHLAHDQNSIVLRYSDFNYAEKNATLYQYRLEGVDDDWCPVTNRCEVGYNNLAPGTYVFHLRAYAGQTWSEEATLTLRIASPWYSTWWMYIFYLLFFSALAYQLWKYFHIRQTINRQASEIIHSINPEEVNDKVVAIVSDNHKFIDQMKGALGGYFRFEVYASVDEAVDGIVANVPSAMVCDAAIGGGQGFDVVSKIKNHHAAMTLPVVLLAQHRSEANEVKAYQCGADDYMGRPYNNRLVLARVAQLVSWMQKRQAVVPETAKCAKPDSDNANAAVNTVVADDNNMADVPTSPIVLTPQQELEGTEFASVQDKRFKERLDYLLTQHLGNQDLNIDMLADMVQMGHTKFYGKVKEVTGMTPNKYLMQERMRVAGELLLEGRLNISEVSYRVGFQDQSYFNKCFKKYYGVVPSKYGK